MSIKDFIGKVVISANAKKRYVLREITAPYLSATDVTTGYSYRWNTINGDPITNKVLLFEDASLTEPFKIAYDAHCRSEVGYIEEFGYWMRRD